MSRNSTRNGESTGARSVQLYLANQFAPQESTPDEKTIMLKISGGSEHKKMLVFAARHFNVTPTKAARILLRAGFLSLMAALAKQEVK